MTKLHLGCGEIYLEGWVNVDGHKEHRADMYFDFSRSFPIASESMDAIVSQHAIEHTNLKGGIVFLGESYRVLKTGGKIRISCPDLETLVNDYIESKQSGYNTFWKHFNQDERDRFGFETPCQHVNDAMNGWGHQYIYDFDDMYLRMQKIGFKNIVKKTATDMSDVFAGTEVRRPISLYVEAEK